ncbi:MAG: hypothetical protein Q4B52_03425 [Tissierellia bacterium]|nr:hypothetical protein [Tissierellia bacterium]
MKNKMIFLKDECVDDQKTIDSLMNDGHILCLFSDSTVKHDANYRVEDGGDIIKNKDQIIYNSKDHDKDYFLTYVRHYHGFTFPDIIIIGQNLDDDIKGYSDFVYSSVDDFLNA